MLARHELGMTCRLAQPEERLESGEHAAGTARCERLGDLLLRRYADGVVDASLGLVELDVEHGLAPWRKLGEYLALHAAKDERTYFCAKPLRSLGLSVADGTGVAFLKVAPSSEKTRIREVHDAPQLL